MEVIEAFNLSIIIGLYSKLYQNNRASVLKHITLSNKNYIDNIGNGLCIDNISY